MNSHIKDKIKWVIGNPLVYTLENLNGLMRFLAEKTHKAQMWAEWRFLSPEWMNHFGDLYYQWGSLKKSHWLERGIFSNLALSLFNKPKVLELCCGDGFNAKHFYSHKAEKIIAIDFDKKAIKHAKKWNKCSNIDFIEQDIRNELPNGLFDNIIWDAAIEHFTPKEIENLMKKIKKILCNSGVLSGQTIVERSDGKLSLHQHEYEFKSKEDLYRFFEPYFKKIKIFETITSDRHNLYFYASNGATLPFDSDWKFQKKSNDLNLKKIEADSDDNQSFQFS